MPDLLASALAAHGGLARWNSLTSVRADLSVTGAIWAAKGRAEVFRDVAVEADLHRQRIVLTPASWEGRRADYRENVLSLLDGEGRVLQRSDDPAAMFAQPASDDPWTDLQAAYCASQVLWTQLTLPFVYTHPGVVMAEVEPRVENGETWRRLQVDFPGDITALSARQTSAFGPDGLLRRHEFTVDILGGATAVLYATDMRVLGGIAVPTRCRVYAYDANRDRVPQPMLLAVDVRALEFREQ
jgi:hypothetical protein